MSLGVFIHNSLEDIGLHQILQEIDFDALPDGDEFEAFLGEWLKQFSPKFPVSFGLLPEAMPSQGHLTSLPLFPSSSLTLVILHQTQIFFHLIRAPVSREPHRFR